MDCLGGLVDTRCALYPPYVFWFRLVRLKESLLIRHAGEGRCPAYRVGVRRDGRFLAQLAKYWIPAFAGIMTKSELLEVP